MNDIRDDRPLIEYPTTWVYKVIGADPAKIEAAVAAAAGDDPYDLSPSKTSSSGKYRSFNVKMTVRDEDHRGRVFEALREHPDIVMVL